MSNQLEHYGLNGANKGLNGLFGKAWQFVKRNAKFVGTIGAIVGEIMDAVDGACRVAPTGTIEPSNPCTGIFSTNRDYTLTDAENAQVVAWAENSFSPFYNSILDKMNGMFVEGTTLDIQLKLINEAVTKMSIFKAYLATNPNSFSVNANQEQFNGVTEFFEYVHQAIKDIIYESSVLLDTQSTKVNSTGLDFKPFSVPTMSANADLWKVANGGIIPNSSVLTIPEGVETIATSTENVSSGNGFKWFLGITVGALLIRFVTKKNN